MFLRFFDPFEFIIYKQDMKTNTSENEGFFFWKKRKADTSFGDARDLLSHNYDVAEG